MGFSLTGAWIPASTPTAVELNTEVMACLWDFHQDGY